MRISFLFSALLMVSSLLSCTQEIHGDTSTSKEFDGRSVLGESYARSELKKVLNKEIDHNVVNDKNLIIKSQITAIASAEPVLFDIYGKENITKQKPYETYLIDNHWIITGTLPKGSLGGTFLIIIDARNGQILRITHGK